MADTKNTESSFQAGVSSGAAPMPARHAKVGAPVVQFGHDATALELALMLFESLRQELVSSSTDSRMHALAVLEHAEPFMRSRCPDHHNPVWSKVSRSYLARLAANRVRTDAPILAST